MTGTPQTGIVMAFDYGLKRIGVAVGNGFTRTATALEALPARDGVPDWQRVAELLSRWQPRQLVVGLPLNMDDSPSEMSARAERFARRLEGRFGIPCAMMDERLSTFEARGLIAEAGSRASRDSVAACLVLESWFASGSD
ncbi:MAG: Holliday junction resolvase RuvX [Gammaproteobacteria bacterium]